MRVCHIYVLRDPRDNSVRYVGQTINPRRRRWQHLNPKTPKHPVAHWAKKMRSIGMTVLFELIDSCSGCGDDLERKWIKSFREQGARLYNLTDGGNSQLVFSEQTIAKIKATQNRPDIRQAKAERAKRFWETASPEFRERQRNAARSYLLGRPKSPEAIAKTAAAHTGKPKRPESIAKRSAARRGKPQSPETRLKISLRMKEVAKSAEHMRQFEACRSMRLKTEQRREIGSFVGADSQ